MSTPVEDSKIEWEETVDLHDAIAHLEAAESKLGNVESNTLDPLTSACSKWREDLARILGEARQWHDLIGEAQKDVAAAAQEP